MYLTAPPQTRLSRGLGSASDQTVESRSPSASGRGPVLYFTGSVGKTWLILGSTDPRMQWTAGFTFVKPEPRFRYKGSYAQLGQELYFERSWTDHGGRGFGRNRSDAYGFLGFARFRWSRAKGAAPFWDIGFGLQYASRRTHDLGGRLNSTPFLDYGYAFTVGGKEVLVGIRWLHISNGGFAARNSGQNQFSLMVSSRF